MWYSYAIVRVVPRVERGEFLNAGVILLAREQAFLGARMELDAERLRKLAPWADLAALERHLAAFLAICAGEAAGGPIANLAPAERFHWLVAPRSTIIQTSPVHAGRGADPTLALEELLREFVRAPAADAAAQAAGIDGA